MERLKLEKVYVNIREEDKPIFFFECINMAAVLLFWDTNMAAVIMRKRKLKIRKLIVITIKMVIIIIIILIIIIIIIFT